MAKSTRALPNILKRYAYYWSLIVALIIHSLWYSIYGSLFVKVPQDYQWILALFHIYVRDLFSKFILEVAHRSAGKEARGKMSIKFLAGHYISTKHALFLGAIVGGVATPASSLCIMGTDFAKAMLSGYRIIKKHKKGDQIEGKQIALFSFL